MHEPLLVLNAGSSSIKFSVFETCADRSLAVALSGKVEGIGTSGRLKATDAQGAPLVDKEVSGASHSQAFDALKRWFFDHLAGEPAFKGIGHRVVHGGAAYAAPVLIDAKVMAEIEKLVPLAPLHQPHAIAAIRAVASSMPEARQVACFDTAFHATAPRVAKVFALPRSLTEKEIRRYGFHGLSYEYIAERLFEIAPDRAKGKVVVAHLGNGVSMCAIEAGKSVATTMGFTALDGLPMGTRAGSLDPGIILYLMQSEGMSLEAVEDLLYHRSGLRGMSGISSDMRTLLASEAETAREAVDFFCYRIARELGSLAAALQGLDAFVFTAGIGENAAPVRARVCRQAAWLGIELDEEANEGGGPLISTQGSAISVYVVPTDENLMIARHTLRLLDKL
jgi:acetate kinase